MRRFYSKAAMLALSGAAMMVLSACGGSGGTPTDVAAGALTNTTQTVTIQADEPTINLSSFLKASVVIGQPDFNTTEWSNLDPDNNNFSLGTYSNPIVIEERLYIGDYGWNRVMGFNGVPVVNGMNADFVLGQDEFNTSILGNGYDNMGGPQSVASTEGKFFVVEWGNSQVLVYNGIPTQTGVKPDYVIGQENFGDINESCSDNRLEAPEDIYAIDGKLIIADSGHNRVLIYNTIPTASNASADIVLGQSDFTHCAENRDQNVSSADSLVYPSGIWSDGQKLVVNDLGNNRVLIWNTFPTTNGQPADIVLGQNDFNMSVSNDDNQDGTDDGQPSARTLMYPYNGLYSNGVQLFITDTGNNRVLIWNQFPTSNFTPADIVLGQSDFTMNAQNDDDQNGTADGQPSARTLSVPNGVYQYNNKIFVTDQGNGRVLIFDGE